MESSAKSSKNVLFEASKGYDGFVVIFLLGIVAYYLLCLVSYSPEDASRFSGSYPVLPHQNLGGTIGVSIAAYTYYFLGVASYVCVFPLLQLIWKALKEGVLGIDWVVTMGWLWIGAAVCGLGSSLLKEVAVEGELLPAFGIWGQFIHRCVSTAFGSSGQYIVYGTVILATLPLIWKWPSIALRKGIVGFRSKNIGAKGQPLAVRTMQLSHRENEISLVKKIFQRSSDDEMMTDNERSRISEVGPSLLDIFSEFGVEGRIVGTSIGPVVSVYEFEPKAGTRVSKVTGLAEEIALHLKVDSVLISPISGKRALGIQVPLLERREVRLGDLTNSDVFWESDPLVFPLGKGIGGDPVYSDLKKMPHFLIAGQTGSGKSVAINGLLCSLLLKSPPDLVRFLLIDLKVLELKVYEGIPHLLMPVITEAERAAVALKWATVEMERRYQLLATMKVRNIEMYHSLNPAGKTLPPLPYIVIIIDELADLMLFSAKEVEGSILRLAQKARACGIHLVLATQRPSVDVITGVIKANLPCRGAFKVFSRTDSRTILDCMGAERLLGNGDMLLMAPGASRIQRIQNGFIEDWEVLKLVRALSSRGASYDKSMIAWIDQQLSSESLEK